MATLFAKTAGGVWSAAGTWSNISSVGVDNSGPPTSADDAVFDATSGNVTIDTGAVAKSVNCTGYTGVLTHNSAVTLTVSGSITLVAGMTYTLNNAATSALAMNATGTLTTGGKTIGNFVGSVGTVTLGDNVTSTGTTWTVSSFTNNGKDVAFIGAGTVTISPGMTWNNLTRTGTATKTDSLNISGNHTINTLTLNSNSVINRLFVQSTSTGLPRILTVTTLVCTNVIDFTDITGAGGATWTTGASGATYFGDALGNSGITFTPAATQTATGTTSFNWSTHGWTSRVPLPQDDVVINNAFVAGQTITQDMPRSGKSLNMTGATGTPIFTWNANTSFYGSLTFISGMTFAGTQSLVLQGRGVHTITSAGLVFPNINFNIQAVGGSYTLQDNFANTGTSGFGLIYGTFDTNSIGNYSISINNFGGNVTNTRALNLNASTFTITGTTGWNLPSTTGFTFNAGTSTVKLTSSSASTVTFNTGGRTFNNVWFAPGTGTGTLNVSGTNIFNDFKDDGTAAHSVLFQAGFTQTFTTWSGFTGNVVTIGSQTASGHTLTKAGGGVINVALAAVSRSTATPSSTWYASSVATDGGNNSGWIFTAQPSTGTVVISSTMLLLGVG